MRGEKKVKVVNKLTLDQIREAKIAELDEQILGLRSDVLKLRKEMIEITKKLTQINKSKNNA
jgi:uncharacterized coiled-coil protein SlyX